MIGLTIIGLSIFISVMLVLSVWLIVIFITEIIPDRFKDRVIKNRNRIVFLSWFILMVSWLILVLV